MISWLWLISLTVCAQFVEACIPSVPGDDMSCPAVPQTLNVDDFDTNPVTFETGGDGERTLKCADANDILLEVDGTTGMEIPAGTTVVCKVKSGKYVFDDGTDETTIGTKKFACGQPKVDCPMLMAWGAAIPNVDTTPVPAPSMNGKDLVYSCPSPQKMYKVENGDVNTADTIMNPLSCLRNSGKLTQAGDTTTDLSAHQFVCGLAKCASCDQSVFLAPDSNACTSSTSVFCKSKATTTEDELTGCLVVSCGSDSPFLLDASDVKTSIMTSDIQCNDGVWEVMSSTLVSEKIVCGTAQNCESCKAAVAGFFTAGGSVQAGDLEEDEMNPQCTYTCPASSRLFVDSAERTAVVCNMETTAVTENTPGGAPITAANNKKFDCVSCMCDTSELNAGDQGQCPPGKLCTTPTAIDQCEATCPADSQAVYQVSGDVMTSATITCSAADQWIVDDSDPIFGVTCAFNDGKGFTTDAPDISPLAECPALMPFNDAADCQFAVCDSSQLVYVRDGETYKVTCKEGHIVPSGSSASDGELSFKCGSDGMWQLFQGVPIDSVTCIMQEDSVQGCAAALTLPPTSIILECRFGQCYLKCKNAAESLNFNAGNGVVQDDYLRCVDGVDFYDKQGAPVADPSMITCV